MRPYAHASLAAGLALAACRAYEPTIPERQDREPMDPSRVEVSLAEEFPEELSEYVPQQAPRRHSDFLAGEGSLPTIGDDQLIQLEFRDAELAGVLHLLAGRAGINLQVGPEAVGRVDASFPAITVDAALHAVLRQAGLKLVEQPASVFHVAPSSGRELIATTFELQSAQAAEVEPGLRVLVGSGTQVVADPTQNLILVRGPRDDVAAIAEYLDATDRLRRQVLIEVRILELTLEDDFELGVAGGFDASIDGNALSLLQNLATPDDSFQLSFDSSDGTIDATINAISRYVGTELISSPRVLALSGTEATIEVVREVPYVNVTSTTSGTTGGVGTQVIEEVVFKEAGVRLKVTPTIQAGGAIQVHTDTSLSEVIGVFNQVPIIDTRGLVADFLVSDRQTVVLGGLMQDTTSETDSGVPWLSRIPLVGRLFRSDEDQTRKRELVLFLTPRVVDHDEAARLVRAMRRNFVERVRDTGTPTLLGR
jgi:type II secretory pathway component GspD/PulD (secretin)